MSKVGMGDYPVELPDNSHQARAERKQEAAAAAEKRAEKVVTGKVKTKKNEVRKLTEMFISEDAANIKNYIVFDVLIPVVKKAIYEIVVGSIDMSLFGGRGANGGKRPNQDKISFRDYNSISSGSSRDERPRSTGRSSVYSYDDIVYTSRGEAEAVLDRMDELMDQYKQVRVADMYELSGITGEYTDRYYGWTDIRSAKIVREIDGYRIAMPRARDIR